MLRLRQGSAPAESDPPIVTSGAANNVIAVADIGSLYLDPTENYNGTVSFGFRLRDSGMDNSESAEATFTIAITPVNDRPTALAFASGLSVPFDIETPDVADPFVVGDISPMVSDPEGDPFAYALTADSADIDNERFRLNNTELRLVGSVKKETGEYTLRIAATETGTSDDYSIEESLTLPVNTLGIVGSGHDTLFGTADDGPVLSGQEVIGEERPSAIPLAIGRLVDGGAGGSGVFEVGNSVDGTFATRATHGAGATFEVTDGNLIFTAAESVGGFVGSGDYEEDLGTDEHPTYSVWVKSTSGGQSRVRGYEFNLYDRVETVQINGESEVITIRDFHIRPGHTWLRLINSNVISLEQTLHWANDPHQEIIADGGDTLDIDLGGGDTDSDRFLTHGLIYRAINANTVNRTDFFYYDTADVQAGLTSNFLNIIGYAILPVNHILLVDLGDDDRVGGSDSNADEELVASGLNRVIPEELAAGATHTIGFLDSDRPGPGAVAFTISTDSTDGRDGNFAASSGDFSITGDATSGFRLIFTAPTGGSGDFESSPPTYPVWVRSVRNGITDTARYTLRLFDISGS